MRKIIAIGGPHGSGKSACAKRLAEALDMTYISAGQVFRKLAQDRNMSMEEFSKNVVNDPDIDFQIDNRTKELGQIENTVVDAQLAAHFTPKDIILKICITANKEIRWERIAKRQNISIEASRRETETREETESNRFLELYNIDVQDLSVYDVVINNNRIDEDETFNLALAISKEILDI